MVKSRPCQRCKEMSPEERLEAVPETRLCVRCSQKVGGDTRLVVRTRNTGKGGIKQTGVDIDSVRLVRREVPLGEGE
jgi:hypothetical protein